MCVTLRCLGLILEAPNRRVKIFCWSLAWIFWLDPADLLDHCSPTRHLQALHLMQVPLSSTFTLQR